MTIPSEPGSGRTGDAASGRLAALMPHVLLFVSAALSGAAVALWFWVPSGPVTAPEMPEKAIAEEERQLFLTSGGLYTDSDIEANGGRVPSEVFRGFRAVHDHSPAAGVRICPISRTKASAECTWVVNGETHQFCCPPCIDEFVRLAKARPESIRPATAYVQQE